MVDQRNKPRNGFWGYWTRAGARKRPCITYTGTIIDFVPEQTQGLSFALLSIVFLPRTCRPSCFSVIFYLNIEYLTVRRIHDDPCFFALILNVTFVRAKYWYRIENLWNNDDDILTAKSYCTYDLHTWCGPNFVSTTLRISNCKLLVPSRQTVSVSKKLSSDCVLPWTLYRDSLSILVNMTFKTV